MATTTTPSFLDEYRKLVKSWVSRSDANAQAKKAVATVTAGNTAQNAAESQVSAIASNPLPYINNPDGSPVTTPTPTPVWVNPSTKWLAVTWADATTPSAAEANIDETQASIDAGSQIASSELQSQVDITKQLGEIDQTQLDTKTAEAKAVNEEYKAVQTQQMADKTANEIEYQKELQRQWQEDIAALKTAQESENSQNQAAAAEMKAKNDSAEHEMSIQNELSLQSASIAFAKLWLSFSGAAINQAQNIFATGAYNLAKLKTGNAKNYADLQVKINRTAFDHVSEINKIIKSSSEDMFKSKERLREFIGKAQTNIIASKKETQATIQSAIDKFKTEKQAREDKMYADMNRANDKVTAATKDYQKTIEYTSELNKKKIDTLIINGQWASLSNTQKIKLEQEAWIPPWTTQNTIVAKTTQMINEGIKNLIGKQVWVPTNILNGMHLEIQRQLKLNVPMATAIQLTIQKYKNQIPEIKQIQDATKAKATQDAAKAQADIALKNANAQKALMTWQAAVTKANKTWSGWGSSGRWGSGASNTKLQAKYFDIEEETWGKTLNVFGKTINIPWTKTKKSVQGSYNPSTWGYTYEGKPVVPLKTPSSASATSETLSAFSAAFANK